MKIKLILIIFYLFSYSLSLAQCPININEFGPSTTSNYEPFPYDYWGSVNYRERFFNNRYEIKVDWTTVTNLGRYGLDDYEFKSFMYIAIINDLIVDCNFSGTKQFVFFEETDCKIQKRCYLKVSEESEVLCADEGWGSYIPGFYEWYNEKYLPISKEFICGLQCCEFIYTVECILAPSGNETYPHIVSIAKNPAAGSGCNNPIYDCLTNEVINCESTCE